MAWRNVLSIASGFCGWRAWSWVMKNSLAQSFQSTQDARRVLSLKWCSCRLSTNVWMDNFAMMVWVVHRFQVCDDLQNMNTSRFLIYLDLRVGLFITDRVMWLARKYQTVVFDCRCCARFEGGLYIHFSAHYQLHLLHVKCRSFLSSTVVKVSL